jgi:DNA-binding beta-propeller fold protein YncE
MRHLRITFALALAACVVLLNPWRRSPVSTPDLLTASVAAEASGAFCEMPGALQGADGTGDRQMPRGDTPPVRYVLDPYPSFSGVAVDPKHDLVFFSDTNRKAVLSYRRAGQPPAEVATPLTRLMGPETGIGFVAGVAVDPARQEVYTVNNDVEDRLVVFSYDAQANVKPKRLLYVPHQAWGLSINHTRDEMALSVQSPNMVVVYRREARGLEPPVRMIRGPKTGMADPHGVFWDAASSEIVVANHGNWRGDELITAYTAWDSAQGRRVATAAEGGSVSETATGRFRGSSITVYRDTASGDVAPAREIAGPLTGLNWPMGVYVDAAHDEIVVANNGDDSVLVFKRTATGNAAPVRVLRGRRTGISSPMGVAIDPATDELWVANFGDHTAVVFPRTATGNVAPRRTLRNAPAGTPTSGFGNPYAVAYDSKREEILVPN